MPSCRFLLLWLLAAFPVTSTTAANRFNDVLLVSAGDQLILGRPEDQTLQSLQLDNHKSSIILAMAHDPLRQQLYFSDKMASGRTAIYSTDLKDLQAASQPALVVERAPGEVEGMAFDPVERRLFWTDGSKQSIHRLQLDADGASSNATGAVEVLHFLSGDKPRGLATHHCRRRLFWTNRNPKHSTIESSPLDGGERGLVAESSLTMAHALALDAEGRWLYWSDNLPYGAFRIERSHLDGDRRQIVYSGHDQFVFALAVSDSHVYWTDWTHWTLWALAKDVAGAEPWAVGQFEQKPMAVLLLRQAPPLDCTALAAADVALDAQESATSVYEAVVDLCDDYCLNNGQCVQSGAEVQCRCTDRFTGDRCQNAQTANAPVVSPTTFSAATSASSSSSAAPSTSPMASASTAGAPFSTNDGETSGDVVGRACGSTPADEVGLLHALAGVSVLCLVLMVVVSGLSWRVHVLSKRPRFRRRKLFNDSSNGTQQQQHGDSSSAHGPVIDIENCCNMNICETPCMEPPSRTPASEKCASAPGVGRSGVGVGRSKNRYGDKQSLLGCDY